MISEAKINRIRIVELYKWRKEIGEEFWKWEMFYTKEWFLNQMKQIDFKIRQLEE